MSSLSLSVLKFLLQLFENWTTTQALQSVIAESVITFVITFARLHDLSSDVKQSTHCGTNKRYPCSARLYFIVLIQSSCETYVRILRSMETYGVSSFVDAKWPLVLSCFEISWLRLLRTNWSPFIHLRILNLFFVLPVSLALKSP